VRGIGAAQQGAAADAATHSTSALMPWLDDSVTAANGVAARVSEQAASFAHTRDSMPPPRVVPEVSFSQDPATWTADHAIEWLPGIQTQNEAAQVAAQQDQERARELMGGYQGTSNDNLAVRDHFAAAPTVVAEVVQPAPGGFGVGGGAGGGSVQPAPGVAHPAPAHSAAAHPGPIAGVPDHVAPAGTAPQVASGAAVTTPQLAGSYPSPADPSMARSGAGQPTAAEPFGLSSIPAASNGENRIQGGSRHYGGGGYRAGSFGPRPTAFSTGNSHPSEPRLSNSTVGSAEQAGTRGAARGGGGWTEGPLGAPSGSGRDGDSREHQRASYLIEQDTNAIVGELPRTAPPVIGAEEHYR